MITETGYSKDPSILPEGIAVTFGLEMMIEKGGVLRFIRQFELWLNAGEDYYWCHWCKNKPQFDISYVYVIALGRLYCKCFYGGHSKKIQPHIILAGPIEKPPFKRKLSGFQGFRYTTKLF